MIRLRRHGIRAPHTWKADIRKALPDFNKFMIKAAQFERLPINSKARRQGFISFAPEVLPNRKGKPYFPSCWSSAKEALAGMSRQKCSYCEGGINSLRAGQVEHFKPKSVFPSLAYVWANYFLACGGCNGAKGDKWPSSGTYLRPDRGNPDGRLLFSNDGKVRAKPPRAAVKKTIDDFDLNRKWLVRLRKRHIRDVLRRLEDTEKVVAISRQIGRQLATNELKRLRDCSQAYSAALTQCFLCAWQEACPGVRLRPGRHL